MTHFLLVKLLVLHFSSLPITKRNCSALVQLLVAKKKCFYVCVKWGNQRLAGNSTSVPCPERCFPSV